MELKILNQKNIYSFVILLNIFLNIQSIHCAANFGSIEDIMRQVRRQAMGGDQYDLNAAIETNNLEKFKELVGLDKFNPDDLLSKIIYRKNEEMISFLLDKGANPNTLVRVFDEKRPVLNIAIHLGMDNIVNKLLEKGANVNIKPEDSQETPLMEAALKGNENLVETLLNKGAKVNDVDIMGNTPLMRSVIKPSKVTELLLAVPAININASNRDGDTALMRAVRRNNKSAIRLLLEHGADFKGALSIANEEIKKYIEDLQAAALKKRNVAVAKEIAQALPNMPIDLARVIAASADTYEDIPLKERSES